MKPKVYITRKLPKEIIKKLEKVCEVSMWTKEKEPVPKEVLLQEIQEVDGLFCLLTENIDKEVFEYANKLKAISNMAVGYDNIDITEAKKRKIVVTNTPDVLTETTADLTFALLMTTARRIIESNEYLRNGEWQTWYPMQLAGRDIYKANLGIIGMGRIGKALIKRAKGFDMNVQYYNRSRKQEIETKFDITYSNLESLLKTSDFVCILIPYSSEVHHMISHKELSLMKNSAILINTSRGGIVNESALFYALKNKNIFGAGLDVFEQEPISADHPLLSLPNLVTLPHIGSASIKTRLDMANLAADNIINILQNKPAITPVIN